MKQKNWTQFEDQILREEVARHASIEHIAHRLCKSVNAVYLYAYRHRIALRKMVVNPLMRKMIEIKFGSVEYFTPNRDFYNKVQISQKRWSELVFGYTQPTERELRAVAEVINFSREETFQLMQSRQLCLFED